jgi:nucleotidyltransferase substrate binding protein (TIGR01987 family)
LTIGNAEGAVALELSSLKKAVSALAGVLAKSDDLELMSRLDEVTRNAVKAGVIQHFEFTYELCWKFIKRWLETNVTAVDGVTRRELFRLAAENRLIDDVDEWMRYHAARKQTSHIYQPEIAETVYDTAHDFSRAAARLLAALEERND